MKSNNGNSDRLFSWAPISLQIMTAAIKLKKKKKNLSSWKKSYDKPRHVLKCKDTTLLIMVHIVKAMVFPVVMCGY